MTKEERQQLVDHMLDAVTTAARQGRLTKTEEEWLHTMATKWAGSRVLTVPQFEHLRNLYADKTA